MPDRASPVVETVRTISTERENKIARAVTPDGRVRGYIKSMKPLGALIMVAGFICLFLSEFPNRRGVEILVSIGVVILGFCLILYDSNKPSRRI
jgi:hypothetical protein